MHRKAAAWATDDWLAVVLGLGLLAMSLAAVLAEGPAADGKYANPFAAWVGKPSGWTANPWDSLGMTTDSPLPRWLLGSAAASLAAFLWASWMQGVVPRQYVPAWAGVFGLAWLAQVVTAQRTVSFYNLEYALWALLIGLLMSNTLGTPHWMRPAVRTELYIKTGLVLYGAKVLFSRLMELGPPGLAVAWIVTPIVLVTTYWFGQRVLKIASPTLNIVISADMSVCGVSAAIATAAACRAKKEELSLAVGISLAFTVLMMLVMPPVVRALGLSPQVGGAWIGGTVDSTAAVLAAGQALGDEAAEVAITIKMIQNILIGVTALGVAMYWVRYVDVADAAAGESAPSASAWEIWHRFPKFVLGFLAASAAFSLLYQAHPQGKSLVDAAVKQGTAPLEGWFFALAFISIGLESDFRVLGKYLRGGKPLALYVCGQSFNILLTLAMASLVFGSR